jgi:hypothetical protein
MRVFDVLKEEVGKAPLGSFGAAAGILTLLVDLWPTSPIGTAAALSVKEKLALALLSSAAISFIFAYIPARFLNIYRTSTKFIYLIVAVMSALLMNSQFQTRFPHSGEWGSINYSFMLVFGFILSGLYYSIYVETMNAQRGSRSRTAGEFIGMITVGVIQAFIIADGISLTG